MGREWARGAGDGGAGGGGLSPQEHPGGTRGRGQPGVGLDESSPAGATSEGMLLRDSPREDFPLRDA